MARKSLIPAGSFLQEGDAEGPNDPGLLERIVQNDAVKHGRRSESEAEPEPEERGDQKSYDKSYANMTSHTDDNTAGNTDRQKTSNMAGRAGSQTDDRTVVQPAGQSDRQAVGQTSLRSVIQATIQQNGQNGEVLKTVTIKLPPSLDRRVEEHCFRTGRKKQDVVRDGLLLYFEAVEDTAEGEGE